MEVRLYATLREIAGERQLTLESGCGTVGEALDELIARFPGLAGALFEDEARQTVRQHVAIMVGGRDIRHLDGLDSPLAEDSELDVFPPIAGGCS